MDNRQFLPKLAPLSHGKIWIQIFIFKIINGFQSQMFSTNDGQYIYNFVKERSRNETKNNSLISIVDGPARPADCIPGNTSSSYVEDEAQIEAATINQYSELMCFGISMLVTIVLGPMTDRVGRKFLLVWNSSLLLVGMTIRLIVVYNNMNVYYVLISSAFNGLSGSRYTYDLASSGIMADTTMKTKERSFVMILYNSATGIGLFIAQIVTGYFIHCFGFLPQYFICIFLLITLDISIVLFLREPIRPTSKKFKDICAISKTSQIWAIFTDSDIGNRKHIFSWLSVFAITMLAGTAYLQILNLYELGAPFCWSSERIGWYGATISATQAICGPLIIAFLQRFSSDEYVLQFGNVSVILTLLVYGVATQTWTFYIVIVVGIIRFSPVVLITAILSRKTNHNKQGILFSALALIDSTVTAAGQATFSEVYKSTRTFYKGMTFLLIGVVAVFGSAMAGYFTHSYGIDPDQREPIADMEKVIIKVDENAKHYMN